MSIEREVKKKVYGKEKKENKERERKKKEKKKKKERGMVRKI
jgi:hypothetical protein